MLIRAKSENTFVTRNSEFLWNEQFRNEISNSQLLLQVHNSFTQISPRPPSANFLCNPTWFPNGILVLSFSSSPVGDVSGRKNLSPIWRSNDTRSCRKSSRLFLLSELLKTHKITMLATLDEFWYYSNQMFWANEQNNCTLVTTA